jgi:predicted kinase
MARLSGADATRGVDPGRAVKELPKSLPNKPIPNVDKTANQQFKIFAISYNEWIALGVDAEDPDVPVQELRKAGFKPNRAYYYTELKTWRHLAKWLELAQKKVTIADAHLARLNETLELWKHAKDLDNFMKVLTPTVLKDFLRMQIKPVGPKEARPYLIVDDGTVYLCIDSTVHRQSWPRIKSVIVSGIAWDEAQHEMFLFCANRQDAKRKLADLAKQYTITDALKTSKRIDQLRTTGK